MACREMITRNGELLVIVNVYLLHMSSSPAIQAQDVAPEL
jgi:hypothetical protein